MHQPQEHFMAEAIRLARESYESGDYGIGAVIIKNDQIIARGINRVKLGTDPTQHAEVVAIREAAQQLGSRHLENCILYTTHEPCPMCAAAAVWARLAGIVSGARLADMIDYQKTNGNGDFSWRTIDVPAKDIIAKSNPKLFLIEDFMRDECVSLFHSEKITS